MSAKQEIQEEINLADTAKDIAQTFEEIAAQKVLATRASVAQTRQFLDQVAEVYKEVRQAYVVFLMQQQQKKALQSSISKNGKTVLILLSANRGMYGDLPYKIGEDFIKGYREQARVQGAQKVDVVVVGAIGQYLLDHPLSGGPAIPYTAFPLNDEHPSAAELAAIVNAIIKYDTVIITYGKYESLVSLLSVTENISGGTQTRPADSHKKPLMRYLIEPSVVEVTQFFETEILGALFRQKVYEMQLARSASRMIAMDGAISKADQRLRTLNQRARKVDRQISNKKLQQIFAGRTLWEDTDSNSSSQ